MSVQSNPEFMNPNYKDTQTKEENKVSQNTGEIKSTSTDSENVSVSDSHSEKNVNNLIDQDSDNLSVSDSHSESENNTSKVAGVDDLQKKVESNPEDNEENLSPEAKNFKALRDLKKKAERERDEALRRYRDIENEKMKKLNSRQEDSATFDEDLKFDPDDFAEGKHLNKVVNKIKRMEQQLNNYNQQSAMLKTESLLKSKYSDFDDVVTRENLEILAAREPEIAQGLNANPDLYSKAITAYTMIKNLKIYSHDKIKHDGNIKRTNKRIDENLSKPKAAASVAPQESDSPLSHANRFSEKITEEERNRIYKTLLERANG